MFQIRRLFFLSLLAVALLAAGCAPVGVASSWPGMAVAGDALYVASGTQVHALALDTGLQRWVAPAEPQARTQFYADPVMTPEGLLVVSYDNSVRLLDQSGQPRWAFDQAKGHLIGAPLVVDQTAYVPSADANLYALDMRSGALRWTFKAAGALWSQPVSDGAGRIFLGSMDHRVYALDAETGTVLWSTDVGGAVAGRPSLSEGVLYAGSFDRKLHALDAATGATRWSVPTAGWVWTGPTVGDGKLYAGDLQGNVYALRVADGAQLWKIQPEPDVPVRGAPALSKGMLYFGARSGRLYAVRAESSAPVWTQTVGGELLGDTLVVGDRVLVAPLNAEKVVYALNADSGAEVWSYAPVKQ